MSGCPTPVDERADSTVKHSRTFRTPGAERERLVIRSSGEAVRLTFVSPMGQTRDARNGKGKSEMGTYNHCRFPFLVSPQEPVSRSEPDGPAIWPRPVQVSCPLRCSRRHQPHLGDHRHCQHPRKRPANCGFFLGLGSSGPFLLCPVVSPAFPGRPGTGRWRCVPSCRAAGYGDEFLASAVTGSQDQEFRARAGACRGRARSG
jgi:hypothetical protein